MGGNSSKSCNRRKIVILRKPKVYQKPAESNSWSEANTQNLESVLVQSLCTITLGVRIDKSNFSVPVLNAEEYGMIHDFLSSDKFTEALIQVFHNFQNVSVSMRTHENAEWDIDLTAQLVLSESHQSLQYIDQKLQDLALNASIDVIGTNIKILLLSGTNKKTLFATGLICDSSDKTSISVPREESRYSSDHFEKMELQLQEWKREQEHADARLFASLNNVDKNEY
jgi:hypothetical protein